MDFTPVIALFLSQLWYLLPLLLIATLIKTPWFKGMVGEWFLNLSITLFLDKREYRLLKNVTLPIEDGTTQIDHIIVSRFGVFVIETKNMKGWIFGNPSHKRWTQQIYRRKHQFQNPLHQNYGHVMTLKSLLGLADHQLHSIVYFIGDCSFKTPIPENVLRRGLITYIKRKTIPVLSSEEIGRIVDTIEQGRLAANWQTHKQHVAHLKARHGTAPIIPVESNVTGRARKTAEPDTIEASHAVPTCPKCGSTMILRTASRGENKGNPFWGCSGYPRCRGIVSSSSS